MAALLDYRYTEGKLPSRYFKDTQNVLTGQLSKILKELLCPKSRNKGCCVCSVGI